jgi:hypothetical protein
MSSASELMAEIVEKEKTKEQDSEEKSSEEEENSDEESEVSGAEEESEVEANQEESEEEEEEEVVVKTPEKKKRGRKKGSTNKTKKPKAPPKASKKRKKKTEDDVQDTSDNEEKQKVQKVQDKQQTTESEQKTSETTSEEKKEEHQPKNDGVEPEPGKRKRGRPKKQKAEDDTVIEKEKKPQKKREAKEPKEPKQLKKGKVAKEPKKPKEPKKLKEPKKPKKKKQKIAAELQVPTLAIIVAAPTTVETEERLIPEQSASSSSSSSAAEPSQQQQESIIDEKSQLVVLQKPPPPPPSLPSPSSALLDGMLTAASLVSSLKNTQPGVASRARWAFYKISRWLDILNVVKSRAPEGHVKFTCTAAGMEITETDPTVMAIGKTWLPRTYFDLYDCPGTVQIIADVSRLLAVSQAQNRLHAKKTIRYCATADSIECWAPKGGSAKITSINPDTVEDTDPIVIEAPGTYRMHVTYDTQRFFQTISAVKSLLKDDTDATLTLRLYHGTSRMAISAHNKEVRLENFTIWIDPYKEKEKNKSSSLETALLENKKSSDEVDKKNTKKKRNKNKAEADEEEGDQKTDNENEGEDEDEDDEDDEDEEVEDDEEFDKKMLNFDEAKEEQDKMQLTDKSLYEEVHILVKYLHCAPAQRLSRFFTLCAQNDKPVVLEYPLVRGLEQAVAYQRVLIRTQHDPADMDDDDDLIVAPTAWVRSGAAGNKDEDEAD